MKLRTDIQAGTEQDRLLPLLIILAIVTILVSIVALCIGRYSINVGDVFRILISRFLPLEQTWDDTTQNVVLLLRLPRILASIVVGASLSVSGVTYQSIFKNPLAAPELLGVFHGACVGAASAILLGLNTQILALIGGITAVGLTFLVTRFFKSDSSAILVLSGVIVSGLMRSIWGLLKYVADPESQLPNIVFWELGSLSDMTMQKLAVIVPLIVISMVVLMVMRWQFNLLSLGDNEARSLGVNVTVIRTVTVICATLLTSCAVCLSGIIMWVGLIIPHLSRLFIGPDNKRLIPVVSFVGAIFLIIIDTLGRSLSGLEIPLSILTGIVGAPGFILLLSKQRIRIK